MSLVVVAHALPLFCRRLGPVAVIAAAGLDIVHRRRVVLLLLQEEVVVVVVAVAEAVVVMRGGRTLNSIGKGQVLSAEEEKRKILLDTA